MKNDEDKESLPALRKDIYQSNPLIQARKDFDVIGMRIFFLGLQGLNPHFSENDKYFDENFNKLFIPTKKLVEIFGGNTKYLIELKKACIKIFNAIVELNYTDGGFKLMHIFEELEYKTKEGLYLQFSQKMRPYILDLFQSGGYTRINVEYLFKLSSPYAIRLLELLLQYQNIKDFKELMEIKRKMSIEELRFALNVPEHAYKNRVNNLRKYVLDDPIKEINLRTPYIVRYEVMKDGRKIIAFEFIMYTYKVPPEPINYNETPLYDDAIRALCSLGFTEKVARAIFKKCRSVEDCFSRINKAQALLIRSKKPLKNKKGFLRKAIEEDWQIEDKEVTRSQKVTRTREPVSPARSVDDLMTPLNQILKLPFSEQTEDSTPPTPQKISIGRKKMPYHLAKMYINAIQKGQTLDLVKEHLLEDFNVTIEQFMDICFKYKLC